MEKMVYKAIIRYLTKHFPGEKEQIVKLAKQILPELKAKAPDLGGKENTLSGNVASVTLTFATYDTMVGEGGSTLSGGEKQRISIARALLKDAPVILLDEATSSLDPENEVLIQQAISELVRDKTVIVIAHRLQSVSNADQIVVLKDGSVVEKGDHESLLKMGGIYAGLWNEQSHAGSWQIK